MTTTAAFDLFGAAEFAGDVDFGDGLDTPPKEDTAPREEREPVEHNNILDTEVTLPAGPKAKRKSALAGQLEQTYAMVGMGVSFYDQNTGAVILENAEACAKSLDELASKNPKVKKTLEGLMTTSAWGGVVAAHLPIFVMVATTYIPQVRDKYRSDVAAHDESGKV